MNMILVNEETIIEIIDDTIIIPVSLGLIG